MISRSQGYSGRSYDRFVEQRETSTLHKFKETFWTTKQAVIQKLGKKEDEHVVASDSELDAKLEVIVSEDLSCNFHYSNCTFHVLIRYCDLSIVPQVCSDLF